MTKTNDVTTQSTVTKISVATNLTFPQADVLFIFFYLDFDNTNLVRRFS